MNLKSLILIYLVISSIVFSYTSKNKNSKAKKVKKIKYKCVDFKNEEIKKNISYTIENNDLKHKKLYLNKKNKKSPNGEISYEKVDHSNENWNIHKGIITNHEKSLARYNKNYNSNIENYSGEAYIKAINDNGYFLKWNTGVNYSTGNISLGEYNSYYVSSGPSVGVEKNYKGFNLISSIDMNLNYLPKSNYNTHNLNNSYNVKNEEATVMNISPNFNLNRIFYFHYFNLSTYGKASINFNDYSSNNQTNIDIQNSNISQSTLDSKYNIKGGIDLQYFDTTLGVEVNHLIEKDDSDKVIGTIKASYKF